MNNFKKILSFILLSIYVLSSTHGAVTHCHDSNHDHTEHSHDHHSHDHDDHEGSPQISVSHGILHSVVHFIEHLAHSHDSCLDILVVDNDNSNSYNSTVAVLWNEPLDLPESTLKSYPYSAFTRYTHIYLIHSSLRGPPSIV